MNTFDAPVHQSRDSITDIWGPSTPFRGDWPIRVDQACDQEPDNWVQSACVLCSNGCGLDIGVKDGKVVGVRGRKDDRVNKGRLGPKGLHGWRSISSPDRLTHPMIRINGKLQKATWDEAMNLIVTRAKELAKNLTNHSIGFYTSGQLFLEEYYALALVGKAGHNTLHMDGNTRLCTATAAAAMRESFGSDGQPGSYTDIDVTDCIFMVGHNMAATQTVLWSRVLDRLNGPNPPQLIVVDPRMNESARKATVHLAPKIGTNLALLNGILHLMVEHDWVDNDYISDHLIGWEELKEKVAEYPPERVEEITGVPRQDLERAAKILGTTPSLLSTALQGVYQSNQATASACQINNINLVRGLIGKPGSGLLQMNGQPTAQNNREAGCDGEFPGFRNHQNPVHMEELSKLWNIDSIKVPHWNEPTHIENMLNYIEAGSIRMMWVSGTNPLVSLPDLPRVRKLFTQPDLFVVCQDIFLTETAAIADVVLPAAQWAEKTGCFTNVDRTVHLSHKAVDPPGEAKSDLDIFLDYGKRMGFKDKDGNDLMPWTKSEEVFEAWKKLSAGRPCDYTGMSYEKLTGGSGIQWPCNEMFPGGKERLYGDGQFVTGIDACESYGHDMETGAALSKDEYRALNPNGRAILKSCHYIPSLEEPDDEYPLRLSTGRNVFQFHTRTKTGRTALQKASPEPEVRISKADAEKLGIEDGQMVAVRSRRGAIELKARVGRIGDGQVFIPFHFGYWDAKDGRSRAANELTIAQWDPISKQPTFKSGAVRIEKVPNDGKVHISEEQSRAVNDASSKDMTIDGHHEDHSTRQRYLEVWLRETYETAVQLIQIYTNLIPTLAQDREVESGIRILKRLATGIHDGLAREVEKLGADKQRGRHRAHVLKEALFPPQDAEHTSFTVLETLLGLQVYVAHMQGSLTALVPTSQALWDKEFRDTVIDAQQRLQRTHSWISQQIKVRAPQTLLVPSKEPGPVDRPNGSL